MSSLRATSDLSERIARRLIQIEVHLGRSPDREMVPARVVATNQQDGVFGFVCRSVGYSPHIQPIAIRSGLFNEWSTI
jgi:hypothetical protein